MIKEDGHMIREDGHIHIQKELVTNHSKISFK